MRQQKHVTSGQERVGWLKVEDIGTNPGQVLSAPLLPAALNQTLQPQPKQGGQVDPCLSHFMVTHLEESLAEDRQSCDPASYPQATAEHLSRYSTSSCLCEKELQRVEDAPT